MLEWRVIVVVVPFALAIFFLVSQIMIVVRLGRIQKQAIDTTDALVKCWHQLDGIRKAIMERK